ncbi:MAG: hypothetical protein K2R93_06530 [Gemmatimonadaceae bacterium]|nr:hypothetical protein [Gemmatimonadaceae bacterium]
MRMTLLDTQVAVPTAFSATDVAQLAELIGCALHHGVACARRDRPRATAFGAPVLFADLARRLPGWMPSSDDPARDGYLRTLAAVVSEMAWVHAHSTSEQTLLGGEEWPSDIFTVTLDAEHPTAAWTEDAVGEVLAAQGVPLEHFQHAWLAGAAQVGATFATYLPQV